MTDTKSTQRPQAKPDRTCKPTISRPADADSEPLSLAEELADEAAQHGRRDRTTATSRSSRATSTSPSCSG